MNRKELIKELKEKTSIGVIEEDGSTSWCYLLDNTRLDILADYIEKRERQAKREVLEEIRPIILASLPLGSAQGYTNEHIDDFIEANKESKQ